MHISKLLCDTGRGTALLHLYMVRSQSGGFLKLANEMRKWHCSQSVSRPHIVSQIGETL